MAITTTTEPNVTPQTPPDDPTSLLPKKLVRARPLFDPEIVKRATAASFVKLNPVTLLKNPVMFVVEAGAAMTTIFLISDLFTGGASIGFQVQIAIWLWFTVLFANFAEAMAEARGKAQADSLRKTKTDVLANRLNSSGKIEKVPGSALRAGDVVICDAGDLIPGDGDVIEGIATVDESVITGESAPVIRESGGARSAVTGAQAEMRRYSDLARDLLAIHVSPAQRELFITQFIPKPPEGLITDRVARNVEEARKALRLLFDSATNEQIAGTAYGLVQAAGEYLDHVRTARSWETRLNRTLIRPEPLKHRALSLAREVITI